MKTKHWRSKNDLLKWKWKYKLVILFYCFVCFSFSVQTLHVDLDMLILSFGEISETSMVCNAQLWVLCWSWNIVHFEARTNSALHYYLSFEGVTFAAQWLFVNFIYLCYNKGYVSWVECILYSLNSFNRGAVTVTSQKFRLLE